MCARHTNECVITGLRHIPFFLWRENLCGIPSSPPAVCACVCVSSGLCLCVYVCLLFAASSHFLCSLHSRGVKVRMTLVFPYSPQNSSAWLDGWLRCWRSWDVIHSTESQTEMLPLTSHLGSAPPHPPSFSRRGCSK